jgi:CHASE1-domain containing sensor protein
VKNSTKQINTAIALGIIGVFLIGTGIFAYRETLRHQKETFKENATNAIEVCEKRLAEIHDYGVSVTDQSKLLEEARDQFAAEEFEQAEDKAHQARLAAEKLYQK